MDGLEQVTLWADVQYEAQIILNSSPCRVLPDDEVKKLMSAGAITPIERVANGQRTRVVVPGHYRPRV